MTSIAGFLGKSVVTLDEAQIAGKIVDVIYDKKLKKIRYFQLETDGEAMLVPISKISAVSDYASIINMGGVIYKSEAASDRFFGVWEAEVVTTDGESFGKIAEIKLIDKKGIVEAFVCEKGEIPFEKMARVGEKLIVVQGEVPVNIKKPPQKKLKKPKLDYPVEMLERYEALEKDYPFETDVSAEAESQYMSNVVEAAEVDMPDNVETAEVFLSAEIDAAEHAIKNNIAKTIDCDINLKDKNIVEAKKQNIATTFEAEIVTENQSFQMTSENGGEVEMQKSQIPLDDEVVADAQNFHQNFGGAKVGEIRVGKHFTPAKPIDAVPTVKAAYNADETETVAEIEAMEAETTEYDVKEIETTTVEAETIKAEVIDIKMPKSITAESNIADENTHEIMGENEAVTTLHDDAVIESQVADEAAAADILINEVEVVEAYELESENSPKYKDRVEVISTAGKTLGAAVAGEADSSYLESTTPAKILSDYGFLLGRRAINNIKTADGQVIVLKDTVITANVVDRARRGGKLLELILNTR